MSRFQCLLCSAVAACALGLAGTAYGQEQFGGVAEQVNKKMVKIFGAGGLKSLAHYGTGIVVSPDGYVLTAAAFLLDTQNLRVHVHDGRRFQNVKVVVVEPVLDLALLKIDKVEDLPYFDIQAAAKRPLAQPGDWVLGFSNQFEIATRDEPMSVQRGAIAAYAKLQGRRGIFDAPYTGDVYVIDAITNNPGAAGGALTTRTGELLGIIGKEMRNTLTDTWINYAIPIQAKVEAQLENSKQTVSLPDFVDKAMKGQWKRVEVVKSTSGPRGVHGIRTVVDVVERTPPFVDEVQPGSPAARAGLRPDDLIVYVNGEPVISVKLFNEIMSKLGPGTRVTFEVRRGNRLQTVELELAKK